MEALIKALADAQARAVIAEAALTLANQRLETIHIILECEVCVLPMRRPVMSQCGHTICENCFNTWIDKCEHNTTNKAWKCPTCRADTAYAHNYVAHRIAEVVFGKEVEEK